MRRGDGYGLRFLCEESTECLARIRKVRAGRARIWPFRITFSHSILYIIYIIFFIRNECLYY